MVHSLSMQYCDMPVSPLCSSITIYIALYHQVIVNPVQVLIVSHPRFCLMDDNYMLGTPHVISQKASANSLPSYILSHDLDTIHAEKECVEICDFHTAALMFLTGHGIKGRAHACVETTHFPTRYIIRTREA